MFALWGLKLLLLRLIFEKVKTLKSERETMVDYREALGGIKAIRDMLIAKEVLPTVEYGKEIDIALQVMARKIEVRELPA